MTKYITDSKFLRMSHHHLGLHEIQLVFHFCLYNLCDTKCRTILRMAPVCKLYKFSKLIIRKSILVKYA